MPSTEAGPLSREALAALYLGGAGLEIGALHNPLRVPEGTAVRYVDRLDVARLRAHYPELHGLELVAPDILTDGETLVGVADRTQDFVIANHFLEHCQDPIGALLNMLRVLRPGGVLYLAVPDKRHTFDAGRPVTPLEHLLRDHREGPAWSRRQHYLEWARLVNRSAEEDVESEAARLEALGYSIHFHVWTQAEMLELLVALRRLAAFDVELCVRLGAEVLLLLRKSEMPCGPE